MLYIIIFIINYIYIIYINKIYEGTLNIYNNGI